MAVSDARRAWYSLCCCIRWCIDADRSIGTGKTLGKSNTANGVVCNEHYISKLELDEVDRVNEEEISY